MTISITINHRVVRLDSPGQTGRTLKAIAGIHPNDILFLQLQEEDLVIADDVTVRLEEGARIFAAAAAAYGNHDLVVIHINQQQFRVAPIETGRALKALAGVALEDALYLRQHGEEVVVTNDVEITLKDGSQLFSQVAATYGNHETVSILINKREYHLPVVETGADLKRAAGIPLDQVLFMKANPEDLVVANTAELHLKNGEHFFAQVDGSYGLTALAADHRPITRFTEVPQPDGWLFVILHDVPLPPEFRPDRVDVLIKVPPMFPEAAPDMFWVSPAATLANGSCPRSTSTEHVLGQPWQRYSWHLVPGAWQTTSSTFHDYIRCVRARFEKKD